MPDIKSIKSKIGSTKSLKKITNALEIISTIKLQKSKKQIHSLKKYVNELIDLVHILEMTEGFMQQSEENLQSSAVLDIVITTNKGLCGSINSSMFKYLKNDVKLTNNHTIAMIGKKGIDWSHREGYGLNYEYIVSDEVMPKEYEPLMKDIKIAIDHGTYRTIKVHFHYFINTLKQKPITFQLYPFTRKSFEDFAEIIGLRFHDHGHIPSTQVKLEPNKNLIIEKIEDMLIYYVLYASILHSKTGEFAARMIAMKGAKDNATNIISDLTLAYNKARQDAITKEVLEIVSAKSVIED